MSALMHEALRRRARTWCSRSKLLGGLAILAMASVVDAGKYAECSFLMGGWVNSDRR